MYGNPTGNGTDFGGAFDTGQGAFIEAPPDGISESMSRPRPSTAHYTTSAVFYPGAMELEFDIIFVSSDHVLFYVNTNVLLTVAKRAFHEVIAQSQSRWTLVGSQEHYVQVPEISTVLDVILHIMYGLVYAGEPPPFQVFADAIAAMSKYGIDATMHILSETPHFNTLLSFAPLFPLELYTLAAQLDMFALAEAASSHLLAFPLWAISDEVSLKIGPVYLKKLLCLHLERRERLKEILLPPPPPHPPTKHCHFAQQRKLTRSWAVASAELAWDSRVDISPATIQANFGVVKEDITCSLCIEQWENRVKDVVARWVRVKVGAHSNYL